jgi:large subunit ribosomal protein L6
MSKIGKLPIEVPKGVNVILAGDSVKVEGPKGKLEYKILSTVKVVQEGNQIIVTRLANDLQSRAMYGSTRAHINNMVKGVTTGWKKELELNGVGFNAKLAGNKVTLSVGFSHDVVVEIPKSVNCVINKNRIELDSADKNALGLIASKIREVCPPEPYLGKGIKYSDEKVRRKAGKTGKK